MNARKIFRHIFPLRRHDRLEIAIDVFQKELEATRLHVGFDPGEGPKQNARDLLKLATEALNNGDLDRGWKCFHASQRAMLFALDPKKELQAPVIALREEAGKLREWRKNAIYSLLGSPNKPLDVKDHYTVFTAALIRDEHYNNQAYKATLLKDFSLGLVITLLVVLGIIFWLIKYQIIDTGTTDISMFYSVAVFGLFGAIVSVIIKQMNMADKSSTIPETVTLWRVSFLRIAGGAAFAISIYIFLRAGIVDGLFNEEIAKVLKCPTPYMIYTISFCAGFTERFVLRAVQSVTGDKDS